MNSYFSSLLADDIVAKSFISPLAQQGVVEAKVNRIAGFNVFETGCVPDNGENLVGFAAHPSSLAIAMRNLCTLIHHHIGQAPKMELVKRGNKTLVIPEGTPESQLGLLINKFTRG